MSATNGTGSAPLTLESIVVEPVVAFDRRQLDWLLGTFAAVFVGVPVVIALGTNLVVAGIFVALGTLNLFLGQGVLAQPVRLRVGALACVVDAVAVGIGALVGGAGSAEVPLIAVSIAGLQCALFLPRARSIALSSTALFAIAVGVRAASPTLALEYVLLVLLGGLWGLLGAYMQWQTEKLFARRAERRENASRVREPPAPSVLPPIDRRIATALALTLGVAAAVAYAVAIDLGLPRDYWAILTVAVVLQSGLIATTSMAVVRTAGTVAGAGIGGYLAIAVTAPWAVGGLVALLAGATLTFRNANRAIYVLFLTPFVLVLLGIAYPSGWPVAVARIYDTLIGGAIALLAGVVMWATLRAAVISKSDGPAPRR